jgi:7,8-dihydroneopterin aldolase/epimerase/oxygenase
MSDIIEINDLKVCFRVGVPDIERATPQVLLITLRLHHDFRAAVAKDDLQETIDYDYLTRSLDEWGKQREWKLIETLACHLADWVLLHFPVSKVEITIKKYILEQTRHVAVMIERNQPAES